MGLLEETLNSIRGKDEEAVKKAWGAIDNLTKPIGSLGKLEEIIARMAGITGKTHNKINKKNIVIMCADNGMWNEKLNNCPKDLTVTVTKNFVKGITGVCVLGDFFKSDRTVVDIGVDYDFDDPGILNRKVAYGTKDITKGPAMTREECVKAVEAGIEIVGDLVKKGYDLFGTGEMGVCNTATSAAVLSGLRKLPADVTVGKGSGITDSQLYFKKKAIQQALDVNKPDAEDPIDVMSKVGGFDIAGICGCFLGAARNNVPIVIDGFISAVAALCAFRLNNKVGDYLFASHLSAESAIKYIMEELGLMPMVNLEMRLGEGSGCPIAFGIIEAALYVMDNMGTFSDANVDSTNFVDIREK